MSFTDDAYFKNLLFSTLATYNLSHVCKPSIQYLPKHKQQLFNVLRNYILEDIIDVILSYNAQKYYIQKECEIMIDKECDGEYKSYLILQLINQSLSYNVMSLKYNISTKLSNNDIIRDLRIDCDSNTSFKCRYSFYGNVESVNIMKSSHFLLHSEDNNKSIVCQWIHDFNQIPIIILMDYIDHKSYKYDKILFNKFDHRSISFMSKNEKEITTYKINRAFNIQNKNYYKNIKYGLRRIVSLKRNGRSSSFENCKFFDGKSLCLKNEIEIHSISQFGHGFNASILPMIYLGSCSTNNTQIKFIKLIYIKRLQLNMDLFGRTLCFIIIIGQYHNKSHLFAAYQLFGSFESKIIDFIILKTFGSNNNNITLNDGCFGDVQVIHNKINNQWIVDIECNEKIYGWTICSFLSYAIQSKCIKNKNDWIRMNNCYDASIDTFEIIKHLKIEQIPIEYGPNHIISTNNDLEEMKDRSCICVSIIIVFLLFYVSIECFTWFLSDIAFLNQF